MSDDDALDWPARQGEEAIRQLDMLRHTLKERIAAVKQEPYLRPGETMPLGARRAIRAYEDVLSLLGPEPAWTVDPDTLEPF